MIFRLSTSIFASALLVLAAGGAVASVPYRTVPLSRGGGAVAGVGDVNGDGVPDVLVGGGLDAVEDDFNPCTGLGQSFVFSGADASLIRTLANPSSQTDNGFGAAVARAGDLDADGVPDLVVGARCEDVDGASGAGVVYIFSGADGTLLQRVKADMPSPAVFFGHSVAGIGRVGDILIGAPGGGAGAAFLFTAVDHQAFPILSGTGVDRLGNAVAGAEDGRGLVAAFAEPVNGINDSGNVYVLGVPGVGNLQDPTPMQFAFFGNAVAVVEGRGFLVGELPGEVSLFNDDGSFKRTFGGTGSLAGVGDADGDAVSDVLIGHAPLDPLPQIARLFSGSDGSLLATFSEPGLFTSPRFGEPGVAVAGVGDTNGDGVPELVMGGRPSAYMFVSVPTVPSVQSIKAAVEALPDSAFRSKGFRTAMLSVLDEIQQLIEAEDPSEAIQKLQNLGRHLDGCGTSAGRNDWIVSCTAQEEIGALIDGLIDALGE